MQVKDLTTTELKALIRETVLEVLEDYLPDPDAGLEIRPEVKQQLFASRQRRANGDRGISAQRRANGDRGISAEEVAQRFGTTWQ